MRIRLGLIVAVALSVLSAATVGAQPPPPKKCVVPSIQLSPNPASAGDEVDLIGKAVQSGSAGSGCVAGTAGLAITVGTIDIEQRVAGAFAASCATTHLCTAGLPGAACTGSNAECDSTLGAGDGVCTAANYAQYYTESPPDGNGEIDTTFDTTGYGGSTLGFRSHYKGGSNPFKNEQSACVDLVVEEAGACAPGSVGVEIAATLASGDGTPAPGATKTANVGPWEFRITVTACESVTNVSAQGGDNGWAPTARNGSGLDPDTGSAYFRKQNRRNNVIKWEIGNMSAGQVANLDVLVNGPIPPGTPDCQLRNLSGNWSALFSLDGGATYQKSPYTGEVVVSVDTNDDGNPVCP